MKEQTTATVVVDRSEWSRGKGAAQVAKDVPGKCILAHTDAQLTSQDALYLLLNKHAARTRMAHINDLPTLGDSQREEALVSLFKAEGIRLLFVDSEVGSFLG